ncbi:hypothetical protein SeMB42_g03437 [Synchytrium endobioticum]|uniref:Uncharacterized protein n=1 Tax=Synchytrium endobioticum TaxID=286115 RepID=A0A507D6R7_9FUNG|nr:hypothetical protein SeMB42_g03437 [Synchytrium endobioticum]
MLLRRLLAVLISSTVVTASFLPGWWMSSYDDIYDAKTGCVPHDAYRSTRSITLHIARGPAAPAGVSKNVILVNGQATALPVVGVEGETLQVTVENELDEATTVHFHGFYQQNGLNMYDGSTFVAQCPIRPHSRFTQYIALNQSGVYWYHSHSGLQYGDGLRAPVVVLPRCQRPELKGVDSYIVGFTEHYFNTSSFLQPTYLSGNNTIGIYSPDAGLINGVGLYNCSDPIPDNSTCVAEPQPWTADVVQNQTYYLRFVCMSQMAGYNVSIAGHNLTIIEADGDDTYPYTVEEVEISIGQRIGALLTANSAIGNYQILTRMSLATVNNPYQSFNENFTAALHYVGAEPANWTNLVFQNESAITNRVTDRDNGKLVPINFAPPTECVTKQVFVKWGFYQTNVNTTFYPFMSYTVNNLSVATNSSWVGTPLPLLALTKYDKEYPGKANIVEIELGDVVEIILENAGLQPHIWHLHGQSFFVTANGTTTAENVTAAQVVNATYIPGSALRDSVRVPVDTFVALRWKAENPGVWAFHCHIDFHLITGMALNFVVGKKYIQEHFELPRPWWDVCYDSSVAGILPPWSENYTISGDPGATSYLEQPGWCGIRKPNHWKCGFA